MELTKERLLLLVERDLVGTITLQGMFEPEIIVRVPLGESSAESLYTDLLELGVGE